MFSRQGFIGAGMAGLLIAVAGCGEDADRGAMSAGAPEMPTPPAAATKGPGTPAAPAPATVPAVPQAPLVITQDQITAEQSAGMTTCLNTGDAAKGVTTAMASCIQLELKSQDARLNSAYRAAMARRDAPGQARLRSEERAWIRQRDEGCQASATGGTIDQLEIPSCVLSETIRRRLWLEAF